MRKTTKYGREKLGMESRGKRSKKGERREEMERRLGKEEWGGKGKDITEREEKER